MQDRKQQILDTARNLFYTNGYETTSIQTIIDTVGIAKGTFYHHFSSKEDLLDKMINEFALAIIGEMNKVAEDNTWNALDKFNQSFQKAGYMKIDMVNIDLLILLMKNIYNSNNLLLREKMYETTIKVTSPILARIIRQGIKEKVFDTEYPEELAELIMKIGTFISEKSMAILSNPSIDELIRQIPLFKDKAVMYQDFIARLLKAPEGSIKLFEPGIYEDFVERLKSRGGLNDKD